jgi:hypothetical protein
VLGVVVGGGAWPAAAAHDDAIIKTKRSTNIHSKQSTNCSAFTAADDAA